MKLYYDPVSTTCRPVLFFIAEEGIEVELEYVNLFAGENHAPPYAALNPSRTVPFLTDGDLAIGESSAIMQYLADKTGSAAYPAEAEARARVNAAMYWLMGNLSKDFGLAVYPQAFPGMNPLSAETTSELVQTALAKSTRWFEVLDGHMLEGRRLICGDEITLADYTAMGVVCLGELISHDLSPYPNIRRWLGEMKKRPTWPQVDAAFQGLLSALRANAA